MQKFVLCNLDATFYQTRPRARCGRERGGLVKKRGRLCTAGSVHRTGGDRRAVFGLERRVASPHVNHAGPCAGCAGCGLPREGKGEQSPGEDWAGEPQDAAPSGIESAGMSVSGFSFTSSSIAFLKH